MIIKIIPETDQEKLKREELEFSGVKEFFMFGTSVEEEETARNFHEWNGSYRYLLGSLNYFYEEILEEKKNGSVENEARIPVKSGEKSRMIKTSKIDNSNLQVLDTENFPKPDIIDITELNKKEGDE
jgi:hypothetical protein